MSCYKEKTNPEKIAWLIEESCSLALNAEKNITRKMFFSKNKDSRINPKHFFPLMVFDGFEILTEGFMDHYYMYDSNSGNDNDTYERSIFSDVGLHDLDKPLNISVLGNACDDNDKNKKLENDFYMFKCRSVSRKVLRSSWAKCYPYNIESFLAMVNKNGEYCTSRNYFGSFNGKNWISQGAVIKKDKEEDAKRVAMMAGIQFTRRYEWSVLLGFEGYHRACLPTDMEGIKALFKDRDISEGRKRRSALKHWVKEHWRKRRDKITYDFIMKHMRGQNVFNWHGMQCTVVPSDYDIDCFKKAKDERDFIRSSGLSPIIKK